MFHRNLKYYRLKENLTKAALASMVGVTPMAITNYENGDRRPDMETIKKLAKALGVRTTDFLAVRNQNLLFSHGEFRKNSKLKQDQQEYIREAVEEYFSRFYEAVELLGGEVLSNPPRLHHLDLERDPDANALALRRALCIPDHGPVGNLIGLLENNGILIFLLDIQNENFNGMNGSVNDRPYIVINKNMTPERIRTTIVHEIAHFMFRWPDDMDEKLAEKQATAIAGAFLFPKGDAIRELGVHRSSITTDMLMVCKEYGISMSLLVFRAHVCGIVKDSVYDAYFCRFGRKEGSYLTVIELPTLFEQLVYRAINEDEITIQKGAELLKMPYDLVAANCCFAEG